MRPGRIIALASAKFSLHCFNKFFNFFLSNAVKMQKKLRQISKTLCLQIKRCLSLTLCFFVSLFPHSYAHNSQSSPTRLRPTLVLFCQCIASGTLKLPRHQRMCDRADHCSACSYMVKLVPLRLVGIGGRSGLVAVSRGPQ